MSLHNITKVSDRSDDYIGHCSIPNHFASRQAERVNDRYHYPHKRGVNSFWESKINGQ